MTLRISQDKDIITATLNGRLDTPSCSKFAEDIQPLLQNADKKIILDCTNLTFISSTGLRHFLTLRKETIIKGGNVILKGVCSNIMEVFNITGFSTRFDFED